MFIHEYSSTVSCWFCHKNKQDTKFFNNFTLVYVYLYVYMYMCARLCIIVDDNYHIPYVQQLFPFASVKEKNVIQRDNPTILL